MDARGFSTTGRTRYRVVRWTALDGAVLAGGLAVLAGIVVLR